MKSANALDKENQKGEKEPEKMKDKDAKSRLKRAAMSSATTSEKKINLCDQAHLEVQDLPKGRFYQQLKESIPSH